MTAEVFKSGLKTVRVFSVSGEEITHDRKNINPATRKMRLENHFIFFKNKHNLSNQVNWFSTKIDGEFPIYFMQLVQTRGMRYGYIKTFTCEQNALLLIRIVVIYLFDMCGFNNRTCDINSRLDNLYNNRKWTLIFDFW